MDITRTPADMGVTWGEEEVWMMDLALMTEVAEVSLTVEVCTLLVCAFRDKCTFPKNIQLS